ncbi:heat shock 70 kDa protein precursor, putative [Entamoeba histolytica KU27]|uniref:Heat shock 70 kDa protein, putative n=1 Tax=Entamoeba histolytica KU27 TaxID=885311 RepID=M2RCJ0_ENTHI|nr:heat shock 70 kDa protein precursor, putative [Entamoeba histolytica KU27]
MECVIGIDLGTTFSCMAVWKESSKRVEIITNRQGKETTPSVVAFTDKQRLIGEEAINCTGTIVFDVKRLIGRKYNDPELQKDLKYITYSIKDNGKNEPIIEVPYMSVLSAFRPEDISAMLLRRFKEIASDAMGRDVKKAIITVPAYFNDSQRESTKNAGKIAGFDVMRIINEPTAAAIAYGFEQNIKEKSNVLVFDLGGGTFDVTLLSIDNGEYKVIATDGDTHLGGNDFDTKLLELVLNKWKEEDKDFVEQLSKKQIFKLRKRCEIAKIILSNKLETRIDITDFYDDADEEDDDDRICELVITREEFENVNKELFSRCFISVEKVLQVTQVKAKDVSEVVLVGGSTKIPKIEQMVSQFFGRKPCKSIEPDKAVAFGAALQGASMIGQMQENKVILKDVTAMGLGIEIKDTEMNVVIPRYSPLPSKESRIFVTNQDNQEIARFSVFEGESQKTEENNYLDGFTISRLPRMKKGLVKFKVTFNVDINGMLSVSAVVVEPKAFSDLQGHCNVQTQRERRSDESIEIGRKRIDEMDKADEENRKKSLALQRYKKLIKLYQEKSKTNKKLEEIKEHLQQWWNESYNKIESKELNEQLEYYQSQLNNL